MQTLLAIIIAFFLFALLLQQWFLGWGYLVSPSRRRKVHQDLGSKSLFVRFADGLAIAIGFLVINATIAVVLWRIFVGPIKPIHEW